MDEKPKNIDELKRIILNNSNYKFRVHVVANSKVNSIDFSGEVIKIKIQTLPVNGKANKSIIDYLSKTLKIQKSKIKILTGEKSSVKTLEILS